MLSGIASYIFGGSSSTDENPVVTPEAQPNPAAQEPVKVNQPEKRYHLRSRPADGDDDWELIDKSSRSASTERRSPMPHGQLGGGRQPEKKASRSPQQPQVTLEDTEAAPTEYPTQHVTDLSNLFKLPPSFNTPVVSVVKRSSEAGLSDCPGSGYGSETGDSEASSPEHVVYPSLEESWFVTPPPCFTAGGNSPQRTAEAGPLENLLIEHPSMSVYNTRGRPSSIGVDSNHSESSNEVGEDAAAEGSPAHRQNPAMTTGQALNHRQPPHRPQVVAARAGLIAQVQAIESMQRFEKRQQRHRISRGHLGRQNRVQEYKSCNKHQRRKHYVLRPSGANNNRKLHS